MEELTTAERNTLGKIWSYDRLPERTQRNVINDLIAQGLLDLRVTAKGLMRLDEACRDVHAGSHGAKYPYAAQTRVAHRHVGMPDRGWVTLFRGRTEHEAAGTLWETLQREGFRTGELPYHVEDLAKGHVLSTEKGVEFRALLRPQVLEAETLGEA